MRLRFPGEHVLQILRWRLFLPIRRYHLIGRRAGAGACPGKVAPFSEGDVFGLLNWRVLVSIKRIPLDRNMREAISSAFVCYLYLFQTSRVCGGSLESL